MGPLQSSAGRVPEATNYDRLTSDEDQYTKALVTSLQEELAALRQCVDNQEHSASHHEGDEAEDQDEHPAVRGHLHSFWCFAMDMLPDYVPQPDPSGHMPCSIALVLLDLSFKEEHHSCTIDVQIKSALPLSLLLLVLQSFLDRYLQGQREEDPVFDLSESLAAFKLS